MSSTTAFKMPPVLRTDQGRERRAGFEFEFAGVEAIESAKMLVELFGGLHEEVHRFHHRVVGTSIGEFTVKLDAAIMADRTYREVLQKAGVDADSIPGMETMELLAGKIASIVVPYEICTPPLTFSRLEDVERIRKALAEHQASGTGKSLLYAFGLHINPDVPSLKAETLLRFLRAYLLLENWLRKTRKIDLARRLMPYLDPFPPAYARLVLDADYGPKQEGLIEDYLQHNPTRNRGLDMLAVFAYIDEQRVLNGVKRAKLIKPRPTFHYRLPNCRIDEPDWTVAEEWNAWILVERLADDRNKIARMSERFLELTGSPLGDWTNVWSKEVENWL